MPTSAGAPADRGLRGAGGAFSLVLLRLLGLADKFDAANIRRQLNKFKMTAMSSDARAGEVAAAPASGSDAAAAGK